VHWAIVVLWQLLRYIRYKYFTLLSEAKMAVSIRLDQEIEQRLEFLASQTGRTKAYYLRELIERGLEELEDYYLAADVLERIRKGEEPIYSATEVKQALELGD
jgi:RHH-type transcriptional regulator, rel operon repressor / antitoxin RelB